MDNKKLNFREETLEAKIEIIKKEIKEEYKLEHDKPWIVGFSGGKDSTLVLHLVIESLIEISPSERKRRIYVVSNDTLVESPIVQYFVDKTLENLTIGLNGLGLPCSVHKTVPTVDQTFWVNVIGRGYPSPTRFFRWCTSRMKIRPTTDFIRDQVNINGEVILLLGVRRTESSARAITAKRYDNGERLNTHNDIPGCSVFRPILELDTEDVWEYLMTNNAPWGADHKELVKLYRDAMGGECPIVIDPDSQPSCGSSSIRFGCWTCTVVEKDKSFRNQVDKGFEHLIPMTEFRDWLKEYCYKPENRMNERRNGQNGVGPLTFDARKILLEKLLELEEIVKIKLIQEEEIREIKRVWSDDQSTGVIRKANKLIFMLEENNG
jgi:DNA sulfur modification protein DndC